MKCAIIGIGFVGNAILQSFLKRQISVVCYDKYKSFDKLDECLETELCFLCLPTLFEEETREYNKSSLIETCDYLNQHNYEGIVVIKSTVEPKTTESLATMFPCLKFVHNPEFLTARTAVEDFENQTHIVLGECKSNKQTSINMLIGFFREHYPSAMITHCSSLESECMKIFCNTFYAVKIQYFTELYTLCKKIDCDYDTVTSLMLKNNWINPMHTKIPGPDTMISYGGFCFPKDTNALLAFMQKQDTPSKVLESVIEERNEMRPHKYF